MKKILATLILFFIIACSFAQTIKGDWFGTLSVHGNPVHIVFHITKTGEGYNSTMDSPDQGAHNLATDKTIVTDNHLHIEAAKYNIIYNGEFLADSNKIIGTFDQGATSAALTLLPNTSGEAEVTLARRPQDPINFPYKREDVVFTNSKAGNHLAGTLTMPTDGQASKIVVLITGSGPQNRNEEIKVFNHRPFLVWSDWLTRQGIAVLRYDDRGVGQSTGDYSSATTADFSDDAEAAVNYILSRSDLNNIEIGLLGHSEGGMIAPMVAARDKNVKFIVMLAGPGIPIVQLMLKQADDQMRLAGNPDEARKLAMITNNKVFTLVSTSGDLTTEQLIKKVDTLMYRELRAVPKAHLGDADVDKIVKQSTIQLTSAWYRYFISVTPENYLSKVKCAVLALNGTMDMQVNGKSNLAGIISSLKKGHNKNYEVAPLEGLNHMFQKATTGSVAEYSQITETVDPSALQKVSDWINHL